MIITQISRPTGRLTLAISMAAQAWNGAGMNLPQQHADDDAQEDPDGQVAFEEVHVVNP